MLVDVHQEIDFAKPVKSRPMNEVRPMFGDLVWQTLITNIHYGPVWEVTREGVMMNIWSEVKDQEQIYKRKRY